MTPDAGAAPTVSPAFAKAPSAATYYKEQYQASQEPVVSRPPDQYQPQQYVQPQYVPADQPMQQMQVPQQGYDPAVNQLAAERDAMARQLEQERQYTQQLLQEREQWAGAQAQADLEKQLMDSPEFAELEGVDTDDAKRIVSATARLLQTPMQMLHNEVQQQKEALSQQQTKSRAEACAKEVLKYHPDFFDLYKNPAFTQFLNSRDGYSSQTREQQATAEFNNGNPAFVIDLINRYKQGTPNVSHVSSVPPVQVASSYGAASRPRGAGVGGMTLGDLNSLLQMRRITHDQYREMLKEWRAANTR